MSKKALCLLTVYCTVSLTYAQSHEDSSLLREVSKLHRSNWNSVKSWRGNAEVLDESTNPAVGHKDAKWWSKVTFAYQASPHMVSWNWQMIKSKNAVISMPISNGLIKDQVVTVLEGYKTAGQTGTQRSVQVVDLKSFDMGPFAQVFDPIYYVGYWGDNLADWFDHVAGWFEELDAAELKGWVISRDGDRVILTFESPTLLNRYTADLSQGGNIVSFEAEEREDSAVVAIGNWEWKYEQHDRIWLPAKLTFGKIESDRTGEDKEKGTEKTTTVRTISWNTTELNKPLVGAFTLKAIGVEESDFISKRKN